MKWIQTLPIKDTSFPRGIEPLTQIFDKSFESQQINLIYYNQKVTI